MDEKITTDEFSKWFSTYGVITSQRILSHYKISLPPKELVFAIKNRTSFYHHLILVPLKNVLNGIILQQANDYHVYVQKLFIDYLLSGESSKPPEAQGASTRESLEAQRNALVHLGEEFNQKQLEHETVISATQKTLLKTSSSLIEALNNAKNTILFYAEQEDPDYKKSLIEYALIHALIEVGLDQETRSINKTLFINKVGESLTLGCFNDIKDQLEQEFGTFFMMIDEIYNEIDDLLASALGITESARAFRDQFYQFALRVIELIGLLPEYKIEPTQDAVNRESLVFDKTIGEEA